MTWEFRYKQRERGRGGGDNSDETSQIGIRTNSLLSFLSFLYNSSSPWAPVLFSLARSNYFSVFCLQCCLASIFFPNCQYLCNCSVLSDWTIRITMGGALSPDGAAPSPEREDNHMKALIPSDNANGPVDRTDQELN